MATQAVIHVPAGFVGLMLGDMGYYAEPVNSRVWNSELQAALNAYCADHNVAAPVGVPIADGGVQLPLDLVEDGLIPDWMSIGGPRVGPDTLFSGDLGEILYYLGYRDGEPTDRVNGDVTTAYELWIADHGFQDFDFQITSVAYSDLEHVRLPDATYLDGIVTEFMQTMYSVIAAQTTYADVKVTPAVPEAVAAETDTTVLTVKPKTMSRAAIWTWGILGTLGVVAFISMDHRAKRR